MVNKAVFIDRDGTININSGYIIKPDHLQIYSGVSKGIRLLNEHGFKIIIITNQSGIARGFYSEKILEEIHKKLKIELKKENAKIDAIYYCPHHPNENCNCRKPKPGLLEQAITDLNIDKEKSYMIGDRMLDIEAGSKIGCKTILIPEDNEKIEKEMKRSSVIPDYICNSFFSGVKWILNRD